MEKITGFKGCIAAIGAFLSAKLGMLYIILPVLMLVMIIDYVSGMAAGKKEGKTNSKTGMWGIIKKMFYGVEVVVGMVIDWTIINVASSLGINIQVATFFGLLIAIWLIINELISILENLTRLEVPLPQFVIKVVSNFKVVVEASGDKLADKAMDNKKE